MELQAKYGDFTVVREVERGYRPNGHGYRRLLVRCICGTETVESLYHLVRPDKPKNCGCTWKKAHYRVGDSVGYMVVIAVGVKTTDHPGPKVVKSCLHLRCRCGAELYRTAAYVKSKNMKSCGCSQFEGGPASPSWRGVGWLSGQAWCRINNAARARRLLVDITIEQAWRVLDQQGMKCALSGVALDRWSASLDRIDSRRGYVPGNVQWVHKDINVMKGRLSDDRIVWWAHQIASTHACPLLPASTGPKAPARRQPRQAWYEQIVSSLTTPRTTTEMMSVLDVSRSRAVNLLRQAEADGIVARRSRRDREAGRPWLWERA